MLFTSFICFHIDILLINFVSSLILHISAISAVVDFYGLVTLVSWSFSVELAARKKEIHGYVSIHWVTSPCYTESKLKQELTFILFLFMETCFLNMALWNTYLSSCRIFFCSVVKTNKTGKMKYSVPDNYNSAIWPFFRYI